MKMTGNTILITGGTSGIGRALAEALHARGNKVIIAGRRQELLDQITQANAGMAGLPLDVADGNSLETFAATVRERFPDLNVLINNAGIARPEDYTAATVDTTAALETLQTNVASVVQLTAALLPLLRAQPQATLMTTTSGLAFVPFPKSPVYSATKAFLHNWLDALRVQLRETHIEVLELIPPYVQTELGGAQQASDPRAMPLDAFTSEVMEILEQNRMDKGEILVEKVKMLRWAEKNGQYEQLLTAFGSF
jgi:uncharacterized oxidoreductase